MTLILDYEPVSQAVRLTAEIDKEIDHLITLPFVAPYLTTNMKTNFLLPSAIKVISIF